MPDPIKQPDWHPDTLAVRHGTTRSELREHSDAISATSSFVFDSAAEAAACFQGQGSGFVYSRFSNPTVQSFEQRLAALEQSESAIATGSGMGAIASLVLATMRQGEHLVAARQLFGSTVNLFGKHLERFGLQVSWVDGFKPDDWAAVMRPETRYLFIETPTNPLTEVADIAALAAVAHAGGAKLVVDNCLCTPALQRPLAFGADVVIHSATKFLDGQGRCIGGAVCADADICEALLGWMRSAGPSLSPFNAWVFLKGLETLSVRMERHAQSALTLAQWLSEQSGIDQVHYPGLSSHPQHELAQRQQRAGGGVLSFAVNGGREAAWRLIDRVRLCSITGNLGDTRTTITHPASTTHARMSEAERSAAGIVEGLIRVSVGLEHVEDLQADLAQAIGC